MIRLSSSSRRVVWAAAAKALGDFRLVAMGPVVGEIPRRFRVDGFAARRGGGVHGQIVEIADDEVEGIHGLGAALRHDDGNGLAREADATVGKNGRAGAAPLEPSRFLTVLKAMEFFILPARSAAVKTARTPGASRASATSSSVISPWATGLRKKAAWRLPVGMTSSM